MDEGLVQIIETVKEQAELKSDEIRQAARSEAEAIVEDAKKEAAKIVEDAKRRGEDTNNELISQLRLAARDFILQLKGELEELLVLAPLREAVKTAMEDAGFIKTLIAAMISEYASGESIKMTVPASMEADLAAQIPALMKEGLEGGHPLLEASDRIEGFAFKVGDSGEVTITPDAVVAALKPFVLAKFHEMLESAAEKA